jgi:ribosome recycling factor
MTNIPDIIKAARESMDKAIENTVREFGSIRSGKATTHLLDTVRVEAYGALVPLNQVGMVSAPEPRMLTIQAFDKSVAPAIEKAIRDGDLGLNPSSQGTLIRVPIPPLSEERR